MIPAEIVDRLVAAMVPLRVCVTCGEPSRRITQQTDDYKSFREGAVAASGKGSWERAVGNRAQGFSSGASSGRLPPTTTHTTLGWTDCGHDNWRPGVALYVGEVMP